MFNVGTEVITKVDLTLPDTEIFKPIEPEDYFIPKGSKGIITGIVIRDRTLCIVDLIARENKFTLSIEEHLLSAINKDLVKVGVTDRGYHIYRQENGAGGHTYWSDEIGGGVIVWDTNLVHPDSIVLALLAENAMPCALLTQRELIYKIAGRSCPK